MITFSKCKPFTILYVIDVIAYNIPFMILSAVVTSLSKERSWFNHYFSSHDVWKSQIHSKKNRHCYSVDIHLLFMKGLFLTPSGLSVVRLLHQLIMLFIQYQYPVLAPTQTFHHSSHPKKNECGTCKVQGYSWLLIKYYKITINLFLRSFSNIGSNGLFLCFYPS